LAGCDALRSSPSDLVKVIPGWFGAVAGSPTWSLEAVVVRAEDNQRHPLAVFIDGTPEVNPRPML
jgi:hypothetical protein